MNIFTYEFINKFTRENIARDFLLKEDSKNWFLTKNQLKQYLSNYIDKIPQSILVTIEKAGWNICFTNKNLEKEFGFSFEIYGITDYQNNTLWVYAHELGIQYSLAHEIGHFLDEYLGKISSTPEWGIIKKEHKNIHLPIYYFSDKDNNEEYFANCFLLYINDKNMLKQCNLKAYDMFEKLIKNMDAISELLSQ